MSFLTGNLSGFSKGVISFWFRVPHTSLEKLKNDTDPGVSDRPPFFGIMPLVVFGDCGVSGFKGDFEAVFDPIATETWRYYYGHPSHPQHDVFTNYSEYAGSQNSTTFTLTRGADVPKEPCFVGIDCNNTASPESDAKRNLLTIRLQLNDVGSGSGAYYNISSSISAPGGKIIGYNGTDTNNYPTGMPPGMEREPGPPVLGPVDMWGQQTLLPPGHFPITRTVSVTDVTTEGLASQTEFAFIQPQQLEVTPDHWHHVLLSFDLSGTIAAEGRQTIKVYDPRDPDPFPDLPNGKINTDCKIWLAYDNKNIAGAALLKGSFDDRKIDNPGDNALFTQNATAVAAEDSHVNQTLNRYETVTNSGYGYEILSYDGYSLPTYNLSSASIPSGGVGVPAPDNYINNVRHVEMAELQIFAGVTLDTSSQVNRQAFINRGRPVPPKQKRSKENGFVSGSIEFLGQEPDLLLHGSSKWIKGDNTGTATDLTPTGEIIKYKPEPSLGGPQGEPQ